MKTYLTGFLTLSINIFSLNYSFAQKETPDLPFDSITNKITYSEVVYVDSISSMNEIFSRGREWFAKAYKSSTDVVQMEDKENGKIIGKALIQVYYKALGSNYEGGFINYTIALYVKAGRYKYEITNFHHTGQFTQGKRMPDYGPCENMINTQDKTFGISYQKTYNYYLHQMDLNIKSLIVDLKQSMATQPSGAKKDDW